MTFGDMVRKNIIVKASDLEAKVANDPCQSFANSSLDGFEHSTATLIEIRGSMETSSSVVVSSTSTVETGVGATSEALVGDSSSSTESLGMGIGVSSAVLVRSECSLSTECMETDIEAH